MEEEEEEEPAAFFFGILKFPPFPAASNFSARSPTALGDILSPFGVVSGAVLYSDDFSVGN